MWTTVLNTLNNDSLRGTHFKFDQVLHRHGSTLAELYAPMSTAAVLHIASLSVISAFRFLGWWLNSHNEILMMADVDFWEFCV